MSLDSISHASVKHCADTVNARDIQVRPGHELVPSRYALKAVCHVAIAGDVFRWVPGPWEY